MKIEQINFQNGINYGVIKTDKFKSNHFELAFVMPKTEQNVAAACVLSSVLKRGCARYQTFKEISRRLSQLYDVGLNIYTETTENLLLFKVGTDFIDDTFIPSSEGVKVCAGALDCIREMLYSPLLENGVFKAEYVESEKNRRIDKISEQINNKDRYAFDRAITHAGKGTPLAIRQHGTKEAVNALTSEQLCRTLDDIITKAPVEAVFAGRYTDENRDQINAFLLELSGKRAGFEHTEYSSRLDIPRHELQSVTEHVKANQGRMVLVYAIDDSDVNDMAVSVFTDIFGASPISRLFTNVRERLSLCYYCSAGILRSTSLMTVRSGLDKENVQLATDEINRQLAELSDPDNISDYELEASKRSLLSTLDAVSDGTTSYAAWYMHRRLRGVCTDIDAVREQIMGVTKNDVAKIAASAEMQLSYFLDCTQE